MKIHHIINPVAVNHSSDLFIAQPITFASLKSAKQMANEHGIQVDICFTCYNEDSEVAPQEFRDAGLLDRSVLDIGNFRKLRKLPLIADIISKTFESDTVDFIIYTNVDIAVKPEFYIQITRLIESGYDAFTINRRTIPGHYTSPDELALMYREEGEKHPGHDCFVFSQKISRQFNLGFGCIGANWIGRILLSNLMAFSSKFKTFEDEFLTFHIGDDRSWKIEQFNDYDQHNERELIKIIQHLLPQCHKKQIAELKRMLEFHSEQQLTYHQISQHRIHRYNKHDKNKLFGNSYKGSNLWEDPITLSQSPVFVVGYPRSGTTLVQSKLMTQSGIVSLPETHFFTIVRGKLTVENDRVEVECLDTVFNTLRERLPFSIETEQYLTKLASSNQLSPKMLFEGIVLDNLLDNYSLETIQNSRFVEKTPDHVQRLEIILRYYPNAKIVNMIRHPEKAIFSRRENFPGEDSWDIKDHIQGWKKCVQAAEAISDTGRILTVKLEELIIDEVKVMKGICDFLKIPFNIKYLPDSAKKADLVALPWEKWKSFNKKQLSIDVSERRSNRLNNQERKIIQSIAGNKLVEYGYSFDDKSLREQFNKSPVNNTMPSVNAVLEKTKILLACKAPKLKKTNKKVILIDHDYHKLTNSSVFFQRFLESIFEVTYYWVNPDSEHPNYPDTHLGSYEIAIFWQIMPHDKIIRHFDAEKVVFIPMYDATGVYQNEVFNSGLWKAFDSYSFICFCRTLHQQLKATGLNSFYLQYAPDTTEISTLPVDTIASDKKPKILFLYRRSEITWEMIRKLLLPHDVSSVHIHNIADPGHTFIHPSDEDIRTYNITMSDWFPCKKDYEKLLNRSDIFIAPRVFEGIGMSVLDAMSHGLCVIAPDKPTANEYISNADTGILYDYKNPSRLNISDWSAIGERGKRHLASLSKTYIQNLKYLRLFLQQPADAQLGRSLRPTKESLSIPAATGILLVFPHNPFLQQNGVQTRFMALLEYFAKRKIIVDILSHENFVDEWDVNVPEVKRLIRNVYLVDFPEAKASGKFYSSRSPLPDYAFISLKNKFEDTVRKNNYKFVVVGYVHWARLVEGVHNITKILMVEDCISINMMQRLGGREHYDVESSLQDESNRIGLFDSAIFISPDELDYFSKHCATTQLVHVPHILDVKQNKSKSLHEKNYDLVFVGSENPFNIGGIKWFLTNVMTILTGDIKLAIAGSVCNHLADFLKESPNNSTTLLGVVDDLGGLYSKARLAICPLFEGTGLKIKVVEALSYGIPVISLSAGLIGIKGEKGGCVEVDTAHSYKRAISRLLADFNEYKMQSEAAYNIIKTQFSKNTVFSALDHVFLNNAQHPQLNLTKNSSANNIRPQKTKNISITIVTVTYNAERYLEKTILSIINQDYKELEYIIVDGGSTDSTIDIIKKYQEKISFWVSEKDNGIYDAMNKGVKYANGAYVNFMNAGDELFDPNVCSNVFKDLPLDADLVYGDTLFCDQNGNEKVVKAVDSQDLWKAMIFNHNSLFAKKKLLSKYPFDLNYKIVADSKFIISCYLNNYSFLYKDIIINKYLTGGFSDESSILRTIERWKLVSDYQIADQKLINEYYFQRLLNDRKVLLNSTHKDVEATH
ncbi:MAG: glycosyltransferase [Desulfuromusa sp.]|nr:glycosyltransferase [Desulfuromusa sp.]